MKHGDLILVDTCVIIEAVRTRTWAALHNSFQLETVEECIIEAQTGKANRLDPTVTDTELRKCFHNIHNVTLLERAEHAASFDGDLPDLDPGELDLWIHALQREDVWFLCGPDRASMNFGCELGHQDKLVSMEQALSLLKANTKDLKLHYQTRWLVDVKTEFALNNL
jgi:hypothetical protein